MLANPWKVWGGQVGVVFLILDMTQNSYQEDVFSVYSC